MIGVSQFYVVRLQEKHTATRNYPRTNLFVCMHRGIVKMSECYKIPYEHEDKAKAALSLVRARRTRSRKRLAKPVEKRIYKCPKCGAFHLTSSK